MTSRCGTGFTATLARCKPPLWLAVPAGTDLGSRLTSEVCSHRRDRLRGAWVIAVLWRREAGRVVPAPWMALSRQRSDDRLR
jgi:hypothetical protein